MSDACCNGGGLTFMVSSLATGMILLVVVPFSMATANCDSSCSIITSSMGGSNKHMGDAVGKYTKGGQVAPDNTNTTKKEGKRQKGRGRRKAKNI